MSKKASEGRTSTRTKSTPSRRQSSTSTAKSAAKTAATKATKGAKGQASGAQQSGTAVKKAAPATKSKSATTAAKPATGSKPRRRGPSTPDTPLKQRFAALQTATRQITTMKRSITKHFFDVGVILNQIRDDRLYEVKGYGSFESFVEREIDLNKIVCMRSARIAQALDRDVAIEAGLDRSAAAVAALDGEFNPATMAGGGPGAVAPLVPLHKQ